MLQNCRPCWTMVRHGNGLLPVRISGSALVVKGIFVRMSQDLSADGKALAVTDALMTADLHLALDVL
jgi:hypothetical protein